MIAIKMFITMQSSFMCNTLFSSVIGFTGSMTGAFLFCGTCCTELKSSISQYFFTVLQSLPICLATENYQNDTTSPHPFDAYFTGTKKRGELEESSNFHSGTTYLTKGTSYLPCLGRF